MDDPPAEAQEDADAGQADSLAQLPGDADSEPKEPDQADASDEGAEPEDAAAEAEDEPTDLNGEGGEQAQEASDAEPDDTAQVEKGPVQLELDPSPLPGRSAPSEEAIALRFNWSSPTAAAAFRRGDHIWLVFDRQTKSGLDLRIAKVAPELSPASLASSTGTIIRLNAPHRLSPRLIADGNSWVLDLRVRVGKPERPLTIVLDNKTERPRVLVPLTDPGRLQTFIDPDFGDLLFVAPVLEANQGIVHDHDFPEFRIMESEQGLVIRPKSEDVTVSMVSKTVVIAGPEGLMLSSRKQRETAMAANRGVASGRRLFDLVAWRRGDLTVFHRRRTELSDAMLGATRERLPLARLNLARFYFAHGLAQEALGVLAMINEEHANLARDPQVVLMTGAGQVLAEHFEAAAETLANPVLGSEPEAMLWRAVLASLSSDWAFAAEAFAGSESLLPDYVPSIRHRIKLLAAEARIESGDTTGAGVVLSRLRDDRPDSAILAMADYLEGRRLYLEEDLTRTRRLWESAASGSDPRAQVPRALGPDRSGLGARRDGARGRDRGVAAASLRLARRQFRVLVAGTTRRASVSDRPIPGRSYDLPAGGFSPLGESRRRGRDRKDARGLPRAFPQRSRRGAVGPGSVGAL